ncbi:hypothetical protein ONS95_014482 [Cadophora gregata]|uniref:uncharacterized protein n=1 Tax=Cadophora gregata TaxID=51156 RepID=UPI0026DD3D91|nr:uncharacterized protein ONS95_014482 [Cadophora gregata]KAK0112747.1 hypothetical protein ONS95_014482 [Cadophora gregata]
MPLSYIQSATIGLTFGVVGVVVGSFLLTSVRKCFSAAPSPVPAPAASVVTPRGSMDIPLLPIEPPAAIVVPSRRHTVAAQDVLRSVVDST